VSLIPIPPAVDAGIGDAEKRTQRLGESTEQCPETLHVALDSSPVLVKRLTVGKAISSLLKRGNELLDPGNEQTLR
jgi:hypothetical protein